MTLSLVAYGDSDASDSDNDVGPQLSSPKKPAEAQPPQPATSSSSSSLFGSIPAPKLTTKKKTKKSKRKAQKRKAKELEAAAQVNEPEFVESTEPAPNPMSIAAIMARRNNSSSSSSSVSVSQLFNRPRPTNTVQTQQIAPHSAPQHRVEVQPATKQTDESSSSMKFDRRRRGAVASSGSFSIGDQTHHQMPVQEPEEPVMGPASGPQALTYDPYTLEPIQEPAQGPEMTAAPCPEGAHMVEKMDQQFLKGNAKVIEIKASSLHNADMWRPDFEEIDFQSQQAKLQSNKVSGSFYDTQSGTMVSSSGSSSTHKRKNQISFLANQAQARQLEMARAKAKSQNVKRMARAKYGW